MDETRVNRKERTGVSLPKGFTLLEIIVTMTILGFIVLIVFGAFRLSLSAWDRGESTREGQQKVRTLSQMVSRQLKSIVPYKIKTQKAEGDYLAFEGNPHSLKCVSALPIRARQPEGFVYALYEFKENGKEGGRLILYEQRVLNKDFFEETPKEELAVSLLEGISNVRFEYFREEDPEKNKSEEWLDSWSAKEEKELPKAIRMTVTFKSGKKEGEEVSIPLFTSVFANRFEEVKTGPTGLRPPRTTRERLRATIGQ